MRTLFLLMGLMVVGGLVVYVGCSKEERDETMDRISGAGKVLTGGNRVADAASGVPNIVAEQRRKERIRQNTTWTADNRALHPIEYCQSQLEEIGIYAARLEVTAHEVATKKAEVTREVGDNEGKVMCLDKFLKEAKAVYRECETKNTWPANLGGFSLSRDRLREKIVDAAQRIPFVQSRIGTQKNQLVHLEKKATLISKEQKRLVVLKERIETTISDLKLKTVIDGEKSIADSLDAINDAMVSLGVDYDDPSLDVIMVPDHKSSIVEDFDKIMAE